MSFQNSTTVPEPRKQIRLQARANLEIAARIQGNRRIYIVKDPLSLQYFHLEESQKLALDLMDGQHTLEEIRQEYEQENKPQRLTLEEMEGFANLLLQSGLVENQNPSPGPLFHQRMEKQKQLREWNRLGNIFYFKIPLLHSPAWLDRAIPLGRLLFHPLTVLGTLLFLFSGMGLIVTRWGEFLDRLPYYQDFLAWQNVAFLGFAIGLVKVFHELGHALCARTLGSKVHEIGAAFLFFIPTLYCDVSDSWMQNQKWKRIAIAGAGIYLELILAGCAIWTWWGTNPNSFLHQFSFWLILTCTVHTLIFNANPLMKFDGYFILSDGMDIPNLHQTAQRQFQNQFKSWFGYEAFLTPAFGSAKFLFCFGLASFIFRIFTIGGTLFLFHLFMKGLHLEWLGKSLILMALTTLASMPIYRLFQSNSPLRKVSPMKPARFWFSIILLGCFLAGFFLVPLPRKVRSVGLIQLDSKHHFSLLVPSPGGFLVHVFVKDGQPVKKGDILAVLRNPQIDLDLRLNEADLSLRGEQLQALTGQFAVQSNPGTEWDLRTEIQLELQTLAQQQAAYLSRSGNLTVRAPCDGILMGFPSWEMMGKWLSDGTPFCQIGNDQHLRVLVLVEPADRQLIQEGKSVFFRCHGVSGNTWKGEITHLAQAGAGEIPPQLSHRMGGEVASKPDLINKTEKPDKQHYLVSAKLWDVDHRLKVGVLGEIRIDAGSQTGWSRLRRYLGLTLNWGL